MRALVVWLYLVYLVVLLQVAGFQLADLIDSARGRNTWLADGGYPPMYLQAGNR